MLSSKLKLLVTGWRFLPHSYSIVNQFQCLELLKRDDIELYFQDAALPNPGWKPTRGLLLAEDEALLEKLAPLPASTLPDIELRISFPHDLSVSRAQRLTIFGTAEYKNIPPRHYTDGGSLLRSDLRFVTSSEWSKQGFVNAGVESRRVSVVPHGVDGRFFYASRLEEREALRRSQGLGDDDFIFLMSGSMTSNKGPEIAIKAFAQVVEQYPKALLILKGVDELYSSYDRFKSAFATALPGSEMGNVLPRLKYIGRSMTFAEVGDLYRSADCYLSPYRAEAFNMPVLEAAACGLPVICTSGGPTDEFTTPNFALPINSSVVHTEDEGVEVSYLEPDHQHLVDQMKFVIEDGAFRRQAAIDGPVHLRDRFTWRAVTDRLVDILIDQTGV